MWSWTSAVAEGSTVILAAQKVGEKGRAIGIDFASEMVEPAKQAVVEAGCNMLRS